MKFVGAQQDFPQVIGRRRCFLIIVFHDQYRFSLY